MDPPFCCPLAFSTRVDFNPSDPCYVFKATKAHESESVVVSVSSGHLKTYKLQTTGVAYVGDLRGHSGRITDVDFPFPDDPHTIFSSCTDRTVRGWDLRSGKQTEGFTAPGELNSFSILDHLIAAGGDSGGDDGGDVIFWDRRSQAMLTRFTDTHMDAVTQVKFHNHSKRLVTASEDGLVAVHDVSGQLNEDEGFLAAQNINTSVEELQFYGAVGGQLWCRTGTESLHLWEWLDATQEDTENGSICFLELQDARGDVASALSTTSVASSFPQVDYLLGCHYDIASGRLVLAAGTSEGAVAMCPVNERVAAASNSMMQPLETPSCVLRNGHDSVVRSFQCFQTAAGWMCLTGGEDARVCCWQLQPAMDAGSKLYNMRPLGDALHNI